MGLSSNDLTSVREIFECISSCSDRNLMIQTLFEQVQKLIPFSSAAFVPIDPSTGHFEFQGNVLINVTPRTVLLFTLYYAPLHPYVAAQNHVKINDPGRMTDVISVPRLFDTEYSRDFQPLTPLFYEVGMPLGFQGDPLGLLGLHRQRSDHDFTDREVEILRLITPFLSIALGNFALNKRMASIEGVGRIQIGVDGRTLSINEEARRILNGNPPSILPEPELSGRPAFFQSRVGTYRVQTLHQSRKGKEILLIPVPASDELYAKIAHLGLTPQQEKVVFAVVRGHSNREIAEQLFVCEQTVKEHLQNIFERVKVRRRSELIAKILGTVHNGL